MRRETARAGRGRPRGRGPARHAGRRLMLVGGGLFVAAAVPVLALSRPGSVTTLLAAVALWALAAAWWVERIETRHASSPTGRLGRLGPPRHRPTRDTHAA